MRFAIDDSPRFVFGSSKELSDQTERRFASGPAPDMTTPPAANGSVSWNIMTEFW